MPIITQENSITYSLQVMQLNTTRHGTYTNVVSHVHWRLVAVDEEGNRVNSGGTVPFQLGSYTFTDGLTGNPVTIASQFNAENFIEYETLSEETVLDWIKDDFGIGEVKKALAKRLQIIAQPTKSAVPWDTSTQTTPVKDPLI